MTEAVKQEEQVVEETPIEEIVAEPVVSQEEQKAMQDGWMPLEKWVEAGNSDKDHRSAREFNDRGELLRRISEQNKYIQRINQGMESLKGHHARVFEAAHKKALADLKTAHNQAVEDGKLDIADRLVDQISDEKAKFAAQVTASQFQQAPQGPSPELQEWVQRNRWYENDEDMRVFADAVGFKFAQQRQGQVSAMDVLEHVEKKVKERFMKEPVKKEAAPNPVAATRSTKQATSSGPKLRKSDLDETELKAMKNYVEHKLGTEAEYLAELEKVR